MQLLKNVQEVFQQNKLNQFYLTHYFNFGSVPLILSAVKQISIERYYFTCG